MKFDVARLIGMLSAQYDRSTSALLHALSVNPGDFSLWRLAAKFVDEAKMQMADVDAKLRDLPAEWKDHKMFLAHRLEMVGFGKKISNCANYAFCRHSEEGGSKVNGLCVTYVDSHLRCITADQYNKLEGKKKSRSKDCRQCKAVSLLEQAPANRSLVEKLFALGADPATNLPSDAFDDAWLHVPAAQEFAIATELVQTLPVGHVNDEIHEYWTTHKKVFARWTLQYLGRYADSSAVAAAEAVLAAPLEHPARVVGPKAPEFFAYLRGEGGPVVQDDDTDTAEGLRRRFRADAERRLGESAE